MIFRCGNTALAKPIVSMNVGLNSIFNLLQFVLIKENVKFMHYVLQKLHLQANSINLGKISLIKGLSATISFVIPVNSIISSEISCSGFY